MRRQLICDTPVAVRSAEKTEDGFLRAVGVAACEGTLEYPEDDRVDLITTNALQGQSLETLESATLVEEHPPERVVDPDNYQYESVGVVVDAWFEDGKQFVEVEIRDRDAIEKAESGEKIGLSPGYEPEVDETSGEHSEYGPYTRKQIGRRNNHLAITDNPRGEDQTQLQVDSTTTLERDEDMKNKEQDEQGDEGGGRPESDARLDALETDMAEMKEMLQEYLLKSESEGDEADEADESDAEEMEGDAFKRRFAERRQALDAADELGLDYSDEDDTVQIMADVVEEYTGSKMQTDSESAIQGAFHVAASNIARDRDRQKSEDAKKLEQDFFENDANDDEDLFADVGMFA